MKTMLLAFLILSGFSLAPAWAANEAACDSLGAACVCSHTFQTAMVNIGSAAPGASWIRETDAAGKRCGEERHSDGNMMYAATNGFSFQPNAPGLPAGRNALQLNNTAGMGIKLIAAQNGVQTMTGRIGIREYIYYSASAAYESTDYVQGVCTNDKYMRIGDYVTAYSSGYSSSNTIGSWSPGPEQLRGKWVRLEYYVDNHQNPTRYDFYWKNITDNGPEYHQSFLPRIGISTDPVHYPFNKQPWLVDGYREGNCAGYRRYAYAMLAHWETNSGQRIPPAVEIEGGNLPPSDGTAPAIPLGIRVSSLWDQMLTLLRKNG